MAYAPGQFALFSTTDISTKTIDEILIAAENGAKDMFSPGWFFKYVPGYNALLSATASDDFTRPPVKDVASKFVRNTLDQLVAALDCAPDSMALNRTLFAVMDKRTSSGKSLVVCCVEGDETNSVDRLRCWPKNSSLYLSELSVSSGSWDELKTSYERRRQEGEDVVD